MGMHRRMNAGRRSRALLALALGLTGSPVGALAPGAASAQNAEKAATSTDATAPEDEGALKAQWQGRYRALRNNAVRMRENATKLRRAYGLAQHANYPRGGAREEFKQQVLDTERKADKYEAELAGFMDEARAQDIPPGWIYEVDEEPIDHGLPAAVGDEDEEASGRNPLYDDEAEADDDARDADERGSRASDDDDEDQNDSDRDEEDDGDEDR